MSDRLLAWGLRITWLALPFTVGPAITAALAHHSDAVRITADVGAWVVWAVVLVSTLAFHPVGLTILRCAAPAVTAAAISAAISGRPGTPVASLAVGWSAAVSVVALLPATGELLVNGPAYANERRFLLRPAGALLVGPIEVAWGVAVGLPVAAALLLAAGQWVLGGVVGVAAVGLGWVLGRALYSLACRWAVFVPAGLVLHDSVTLRDPVLFRKEVVESLGPAPTGTDSLDLTVRAPGLALELLLTEKVPLSRPVGDGASARLLFTPTRPGAVLAEASRRRLQVGPPR